MSPARRFPPRQTMAQISPLLLLAAPSESSLFLTVIEDADWDMTPPPSPLNLFAILEFPPENSGLGIVDLPPANEEDPLSMPQLYPITPGLGIVDLQGIVDPPPANEEDLLGIPQFPSVTPGLGVVDPISTSEGGQAELEENDAHPHHNYSSSSSSNNKNN
ncbi:hypothetical protein BGZ83_012112 [Gryganskiella cystojenkinii]|nr:hypothetical protein BGZ83_012112 [Gryganskiella cystojenkinii]